MRFCAYSQQKQNIPIAAVSQMPVECQRDNVVCGVNSPERYRMTEGRKSSKIDAS